MHFCGLLWTGYNPLQSKNLFMQWFWPFCKTKSIPSQDLVFILPKNILQFNLRSTYCMSLSTWWPLLKRKLCIKQKYSGREHCNLRVLCGGEWCLFRKVSHRGHRVQAAVWGEFTRSLKSLHDTASTQLSNASPTLSLLSAPSTA